MRKFFSAGKDDVLKMSRELKKYQLILLVLVGVSSLVRQLFVFLLNGATEQINAGNVILGLILFGVYLLQDVITDFLSLSTEKLANKSGIEKDNDINSKAIRVLSKTRRKVKDKDGIVFSTANILNVLKVYLEDYYKMIIGILNFIINAIVFCISFIGLMKVSISKVENSSLLFIVIVICVLMTIMLSYDNCKKASKTSKERENERTILNNATQDLLQIEPINNVHQNYMAENFCSSNKRFLIINFKFFKAHSKNNFIESMMLSISIIAVVLISFFEKGIGQFTPGEFLSIVAISTIYSRVLSSVSSFIKLFSNLVKSKIELDEKYVNFSLIMNEYNDEVEKRLKEIKDDTLVISKFEHKYSNFSLENSKEITIKKGNLTLLNGKSGAGKSTLIDLLVGEIGDIGYNISAIKYFKEARLGTKSLYDEITLATEEDEEKLVDILKGVCLYENFSMKANTSNQDLISYLKNSYKTDLSTGLDQRVLLARVLYQLDESVDLLLFDEPIGNVDRETGVKIVKFIKDYCNSDKQRFVMLATHQYSWVEDLIDDTIDFNTITEVKTVIS